MVWEIQTLDGNDFLSVADQLMTMNRNRHLPVLDNGRVVEVVTQPDCQRLRP